MEERGQDMKGVKVRDMRCNITEHRYLLLQGKLETVSDV